MFPYLLAQILTICLASSFCEGSVGCQHNSTHGMDYRGTANTTISGILCQRWSDTQPHDHHLTHVGDHNHCRNPGSSLNQVWCLTSDPNIKVGYCAVPYCPPLKALDFSLDGDWTPDANNSLTHASLQKENLPSSFTICAAFMLEKWGKK